MQTPPTCVPLSVQFDENGLCVLESAHARGFHMDWTRQTFWKVILVLSGSGRFEFGRRFWTIGQNSLILIPAGLRHRLLDDSKAPLTVYVLCIAVQELVRELTNWERRLRPHLVTSSETARYAREVIRRLCFEEAQELAGAGMMQRGLVSLLLTRILRDSAPESTSQVVAGAARTRVADYLKNLEGRFFLPDTIDSVAKRMGIGRRRFTDLVRELSGVSWSELIRQKRVEYARQLLGASERPVTAIAFESGFEDLSTFYRAFRRETGMKPEQWRKKMKAS